MKKTSSIKRGITMSALSISALLLAAATQTSHGAITVTFEETGGNVVGTFSGSLDLVGLFRQSNDITNQRGNVGVNSNDFIVHGQIGDGLTHDTYVNGVISPSGTSITVPPAVNGTSESIGFSGNGVVVPGTTPTNSVYSPAAGQSLTWTGATLAGIGLGGLTATPTSVWNNPFASGTDGSFLFVASPIPEPSSILLSGLGCLTLLRRRR